MYSKFLFISVITITLLNLLTISFGALIQNLPDYPYHGRMHSGYLQTENYKKKLHYLFVESKNDPRTDPLILWLNGGPGCSSVLGFSQEHGPAVMEDDSKKFVLNPYSWNREANIIYLESPAGVGFSYIDSNQESDLWVDDETSGIQNFHALLDFFKHHPDFKNNDFYIAGESYAGIYVPYLASNIIDHNSRERFPSTKKIKLKGILVGNGYTDRYFDNNAWIDFGWSHGLYSEELRNDYEQNCIAQPSDNLCNNAKSKMAQSVSYVNVYDIYRDCQTEKNSTTRHLETKSKVNFNYTPWLFQNINNNYSPSKQFLEFLDDSNIKSNYKQIIPCFDMSGPYNYFNRMDVKYALGVKLDIEWNVCSESVSSHYIPNPTGKASIHLYPKLLKQGLKILIYSGDTDGAVPYLGSLRWISSLKLPLIKQWKGWKVPGDDNNLAGYTTVYEGLTFVSIKGTGHMVPQWKPKEAYHMLMSFLKGKDL